MRTEKRNAFLSGLCVVAVALGMTASSAYGNASTGEGSSILAFPKVLADGTSDTIIQITNISNNMVHARCFYVNAAPDQFTHQPIWQVTDFVIWLTKQQPTHWQVSAGRFENPADNCQVNSKNQFVPDSNCANAGIDPGAIPTVPENFVGELKCVEVDVSENPIGGNHLKGEATIKTIATGDAAKYNAIGLQGTSLAGSTGNQLLLNQPLGSTDEVGEYDACPNVLLMNHFTEGVTDPFILAEGLGGTCSIGAEPCQGDTDCAEGTCENGPQILDPTTHTIALRSAILSDLTLIPCTQDFENSLPASATVQVEIYNELEQRFTTSFTVFCWEDQFLFQLAGSPNNPLNSVFSFATVGTTVAHTRIIPVSGAVLGVLGTTRADSQGNLARVLDNIHMEGDRFTGTNGQGFTDVITLSDIQ
jgi:hypothetical protein